MDVCIANCSTYYYLAATTTATITDHYYYCLLHIEKGLIPNGIWIKEFQILYYLCEICVYVCVCVCVLADQKLSTKGVKISAIKSYLIIINSVCVCVCV